MSKYPELRHFYDVHKTIGSGGFSKVKICTHIATNQKIAVKIINKQKVGEDFFRINIELNALKSISHPNICKLYQVIEGQREYFIVMEHCSGGDLFDYIVKMGRLNEVEARQLFRQIVSAVAYLHYSGFAHRDIKAENVLLDNHKNVKLIDFGLCAKPEKGLQNALATPCGSPMYVAPEIVRGEIYLGQEIDIWSLGVLLYAMLSGYLPFHGEEVPKVFEKILSGKYTEPTFLSTQSLDLIKAMLQLEPKKRIKIEVVLKHPWITLSCMDTPVTFKSAKTPHKFDRACVEAIATHFGVQIKALVQFLELWSYNYVTATYFLLLQRKLDGIEELKLRSVPLKFVVNDNNELELKLIENSIEKDVSTPIKSVNTSTTLKVFSPCDNNTGTKVKRPMKRVRSPSLDDRSISSPVKKRLTPSKVNAYKTPERTAPTSSTSTKLGSVERSLNRVRNILTPKKLSINRQPMYLKEKKLCNVSTTQCKDPEVVITNLSQALENKGIICQRKGFTLKGQLKMKTPLGTSECSFQLDICYIPNINTMNNKNNTPNNTVKSIDDKNNRLIGIKRKFLTGNYRCYKKVCEEVLALTSGRILE